jgi:hypothetical protein
MSVIEGTTKLKAWKGSYDFAVDGGAVGTITLRSVDGAMPIGSVVEGGYFEVNTGFTTGASGTGALQVEGAGDLLAATIVSGAPWSTTGRKSVLPAFTGATTLKTTAARKPAFVIATGAITAGKFDLVLFYR